MSTDTSERTPETIDASIGINGFSVDVTLVRIADDDDASRPWRIEAPGERFDGWLMADSDLQPYSRGGLVGLLRRQS